MTNNKIKIKFLGLSVTIKNPFACQNNSIILTKNNKSKKLYFVKGLKIKFYGSNNKIEFFDKIPKFKNCYLECGDNNQISFKKTNYRIKNLYINARAKNTIVDVGENFSIESGKFDVHGEPNTSIYIGEDCQFGCKISLDTADGHTIYNEYSNQILNLPKDISIGSHVWLCENVSVLKGSVIADNCLVGKNSLVSGKFLENNKVITGCPAKVINNPKYENVNWSRKAVKEFVKVE